VTSLSKRVDRAEAGASESVDGGESAP